MLMPKVMMAVGIMILATVGARITARAEGNRCGGIQ
jgi:hypothetical protein